MIEPCRSEIWSVDLNPTKGHEQSGQRPALVVSVDEFNTGPAGMVVVVPLTTRERRIPLNVEIQPPEGGLKKASYAMCENIRSVAKERLSNRWGAVSRPTMREIETRLRLLLDL